MDIQQLEKIANDFLIDSYGLTLDIPIVRNNRLRTTLGVFISYKGNIAPARIEIAGKVFEYAQESVLIDILKHECVHYALRELNKPYSDGDVYFESELKRLNVGASEDNYVGKDYVCKCDKCGAVFETSVLAHIKLAGKKYKTSCCRSGYTVTDVIISDGTEDTN